ncbi:MAG: PT domain-containing protein [Ruminococcus flavefaciens]|nr:PT domain-containing protein [Ruminococcus flavefaciens]
MCKKFKALFYLSLVFMLTACSAKENDATDNAPAMEMQVSVPIEVPAELPTAEPTEEPSIEPPKVPVELPTATPTATLMAIPTVTLTATPTATPVAAPTESPAPRPKGDIPERSYDSHRDFPYENMDFVDDATYAFLKQTYDEIDFYGEFQTGDLAVYDEYIEAYRKLLNNEIPFTVQDSYYRPRIGESLYMKEYSEVRRGDEYDPKEFSYYLFDMDGDGNPELCIWNYATFVFKYDIQSKEMILWLEIYSTNERIHGTKTLRWEWDGSRYRLSRLNENGEVVFSVYFLYEGTHSNGKIAFMVTLPFYEDKEIEITMEMKRQAYFSEENGRYFFNVTEEQYDELTKEYFQAREQSEEELKKIAYTYDELFEAD